MVSHHPAVPVESQQDTHQLIAYLSPMAVISPHHDDAVFSCGALLSTVPGSTVLTIYTGHPENPNMLTAWDERCGFSNAAEALAIRSQEYQTALGILNANGINLDFVDSQYGLIRHAHELLDDAIRATINRLQPASVFFPLGLSDEDHILVSDVLSTLCHYFPAIGWFAYADIPYSMDRYRIRARLRQLSDRGIQAIPFEVPSLPNQKRRAVQAFRSQFRGLGTENSEPLLAHEERYWRLNSNMELL